MALTGSKHQRPLQTNAGRTTMANHAPPSEVRFNFERKEFGKTTLTQWNWKRTNVFDFKSQIEWRKRLPDDILRQKSNIKNPLGVKVEFLEMFRNIPRGRSHGQCMGSRANSTTKVVREHSNRHHTDHTLGHHSGHVSRVVNHLFGTTGQLRGLGQPESSPRVPPPGAKQRRRFFKCSRPKGKPPVQNHLIFLRDQVLGGDGFEVTPGQTRITPKGQGPPRHPQPKSIELFTWQWIDRPQLWLGKDLGLGGTIGEELQELTNRLVRFFQSLKMSRCTQEQGQICHHP